MSRLADIPLVNLSHNIPFTDPPTPYSSTWFDVAEYSQDRRGEKGKRRVLETLKVDVSTIQIQAQKKYLTVHQGTETLSSFLQQWPEGAKFLTHQTAFHTPQYITVEATESAWRAWAKRGTGGQGFLQSIGIKTSPHPPEERIPLGLDLPEIAV